MRAIVIIIEKRFTAWRFAVRVSAKRRAVLIRRVVSTLCLRSKKRQTNTHPSLLFIIQFQNTMNNQESEFPNDFNGHSSASKKIDLDRLYNQGFTEGQSDKENGISNHAILKGVDSSDINVMAFSRGYHDAHVPESKMYGGALGISHYIVELPYDCAEKPCRFQILRVYMNDKREFAAKIEYQWMLKGGQIPYFGLGTYKFKAKKSLHGEAFDLEIDAEGIEEAVGLLAIKHPEFGNVEVIPHPSCLNLFRKGIRLVAE